MNKKDNKNNKKIIDATKTNADKFIKNKTFSSKFNNFENKINKFLMKPWFFLVLVPMLSAGIVLGTVMYIKYGVGAFNEIFVIVMLDEGLTKGQWTAAIAFAVGFLIARVLEAPLVGILDIGGSILTGVGIGIPAVFMSSSITSGLMENPLFGIGIGIAAGLAIASIIIGIRFIAKKGLNMDLGTDVMMGAGNQTGVFLGPLVIIAAAMVNPITGIGAAIGASIFYMFNKPALGGAILGAMILGIIPAFL